MRAAILGFFILPFVISSCSTNPPVQEEVIPPPSQDSSSEKKADIWSWQYDNGPRGPENWSKLNRQYDMCSAGAKQSPVNLVWHAPQKNNPLEISYKPGTATIIDAGYTLRVDLTPQSQISYLGRDYLLEKIEIRSPSEHTLSGNQLPMELQFYHRSSNGLKQAVISLFVITGRGSAWFDDLWQKSEGLPNFQSSTSFRFNPEQLIPPRKTFYHYEGSLTHPPCLEGVQWFVFNTPLQLSQEQIQRFRDRFEKNNRPTQKLNDRTIINY